MLEIFKWLVLKEAIGNLGGRIADLDRIRIFFIVIDLDPFYLFSLVTLVRGRIFMTDQNISFNQGPDPEK